MVSWPGNMHGASNRRRKPRTGSLRLALGLAVSGVWVAGQACGTLHMLLVQHAFCAEHGELIDSDLSEGSTPDLEVSPRSAEANTFVQIDVAKHQTHAHEHCQVMASARRPTAPIFRSPDSVALLFSTTQLESVVDAPRGALLELFRLAPKNSPPA